MKNIKKLFALVLVVALCVSMTGCMSGAKNNQVQTAVLEVSAAPTEGEETVAEKDPAKYSDDIQGLCKFMEENKVTAGERIQMEYGVIGAMNGYKYSYMYDGSAVQLEVYEFAVEGLSETAKTVIESVKKDGQFELLDNTIPAQLSADGRFMLIYTDDKAAKKDNNIAHKAHVVECFEAFTA